MEVTRNVFIIFNNLWDKVANVSDRAAIKVLIAVVIGALLVNNNRRSDAKDDTISFLQSELRDAKTELKESKHNELLCHNEVNDIIRKGSSEKDTIIANLTMALKQKE